MKKRGTIRLRDELVQGHSDFLEIEPFAAQALLEVLKYLNFTIDPDLGMIDSVFSSFENFGYRIQSRKLPAYRGRLVHANHVYHEGFHNLIGLRFGVKFEGRPLITLLNECLGQPFAIYWPAKFAAELNLDISSINEMKLMKRQAKRLGVSYADIEKRAMKEPFKVFKQTAAESFETHKRLFEILVKPGRDPRRWVADYAEELRKGEYSAFYSHGDMIVSVLYVAANCGLVSSREDLRATGECLELLHRSESLEDLLLRLGVERYIPRKMKRSA